MIGEKGGKCSVFKEYCGQRSLFAQKRLFIEIRFTLRFEPDITRQICFRGFSRICENFFGG
jgi:hypothetical protein